VPASLDLTDLNVVSRAADKEPPAASRIFPSMNCSTQMLQSSVSKTATVTARRQRLYVGSNRSDH
jgi:hypothetical protein